MRPGTSITPRIQQTHDTLPEARSAVSPDEGRAPPVKNASPVDTQHAHATTATPSRPIVIGAIMITQQQKSTGYRSYLSRATIPVILMGVFRCGCCGCVEESACSAPCVASVFGQLQLTRPRDKADVMLFVMIEL